MGTSTAPVDEKVMVILNFDIIEKAKKSSDISAGSIVVLRGTNGLVDILEATEVSKEGLDRDFVTRITRGRWTIAQEVGDHRYAVDKVTQLPDRRFVYSVYPYEIQAGNVYLLRKSKPL